VSQRQSVEILHSVQNDSYVNVAIATQIHSTKAIKALRTSVLLKSTL